MKNNLHYSPDALDDLDDIWEYIVMESCNHDVAMKVVIGIMDTVDKLQDFAKMGAPLSSVIDVENDYRFLISGSYMIFYRVVGQDINIDRILYGRRDYLRILFEDFPKENE